MALKQTAFAPLPHKHNVSDITGLDTTKYFASARLTGNVALPSGDTFAQGGWTPESNAQGIYKSNSDPGDGTGFARIIIPKTGYYKLTFTGVISTSGNGAIKITLNAGTAVDNSIATDARPAGTEGAVLHAETSLQLSAGARINFLTWSNVGYTLLSNHFGGVNFRMTCRWIAQ